MEELVSDAIQTSLNSDEKKEIPFEPARKKEKNQSPPDSGKEH